MIKELAKTLASLEAARVRSAENTEEVKIIWTRYATIAGGETERIYLQFAVANDLSQFHSPPKRRSYFWEILICVLLILLFLSYVGLRALVSGFKI